MKKVVLITGASRGLGYSIAKLFLDDGDFVYVNYNNTPLKQLQKKYDGYYSIRFVKGDVSQEEDVKKIFDIIKEDFGRLDILINNAGIAIDTTIEDKTVDNFKKILDVNLIGTFLTCKYAKTLMNKGSIVNISSTNGIDTYYEYSLDYDASKAGIISLTHNFANIYAPKIRVNTVAPGWINTDMNKELDSDYKSEECKKILLNRFAESSEVANVVFFLTSDKASYINNSVIRVDGGFKC